MARKEAKALPIEKEMFEETAGQAAESVGLKPVPVTLYTAPEDPAPAAKAKAEPQPKKSSAWDGVTLDSLSVEAEMVSGAELGATDTVTLGRPHKTNGFRVSTDPTWARVWYVLEPERDAQSLGKDKATYLATPAVATQIEARAAGTLTPRRFVLWQDHLGRIGIWSQGVMGGNGAGSDWVATGRRAAVAAVSSWVRVQADTSAGKYRVFSFPSRTDNPTWPDWALDPLEVLRRAFGDDRLIASLDHPALAELLGGEI